MAAFLVHSLLREMIVVPTASSYREDSRYVLVDFEATAPNGVPKQNRKVYAKSRYRQFLRQFVHPKAQGYDSVKAQSRLQQVDVDRYYQGSWDEGIVDKLANQAVLGTIKLYVHQFPILSLEHFSVASSVSGSRNKAGLIDAILKRPSFKTYSGDVFSQAAFPSSTDLNDLVEACGNYLKDKLFLTSGRIPAVKALLLAAKIEYALSLDVTLGDYSKQRAFLRGNGLLECRSRAGFTPFGMATMRMPTPDPGRLDDMLIDGCDINAPQCWGFRPIDLAKTVNRVGLEQWLVGKNAKSSSLAVRNPETVAALVEATLGYQLTRSIEEALAELYKNDLFKPILDLAAKDAKQPRTFKNVSVLGRQSAGAQRALRIYMVEAPDVTSFRTGAGAGNYELTNNTLGVCGKAPFNAGVIETYLEKESKKDRDMYQRSLEGTIIHELTHFAAFRVYKNSSLPYAPLRRALGPEVIPSDQNETNAKAYFAAYVEDWRANMNSSIVQKWAKKRLHVDQAESMIGGRQDDPQHVEGYQYLCLFGHVFSYSDKFKQQMGVQYRHGDTDLQNTETLTDCFHAGVGMEIITHLVQAIHCFGGTSEINKIAPRSVNWFENTFLPAVRRAAAPNSM